MDSFSLTDDLIERLLGTPKQIISRRARQIPKARHIERNMDVISLDGKHSFALFERQNVLITEYFSCGLIWNGGNGIRIILTRYNGGSHRHTNPLEGETFSYRCHIHRATERYLLANRKTEHYATHTERYSTLESARLCLMQDCNIVPRFSAKDKHSPTVWTQEDLFR